MSVIFGIQLAALIIYMFVKYRQLKARVKYLEHVNVMKKSTRGLTL